MENVWCFCPYCETEKPADDFAPEGEAEIPGICTACNNILKEAGAQS